MAHALPLLERGVGNLCTYCARQGMTADALRVATDLWRRILRAEL